MSRSCLTRYMRVPLTTTALFACVVAPAGAQAGTATVERAPLGDGEMTIVARYVVDPSAVESAMTSSELTRALRNHLVGEFAMPLEEPLQIDLHGVVADPVHGGEYFFGFSALGVLVEGRTSIRGPLSAAVREAHGPDSGFDDDDWEEDSAWQDLQDAIESGLTRSLAALNTEFEANPEGRVPLRVAAVHLIPTRDMEFQARLERLFLRVDPSPRFGSSAMAGWEPPEDLEYSTQSVLIELEPVVVETDESEVETIELGVEALDRLVGEYENEQVGGLVIERVEGELYARPDDPDEEAIAIVPTSPTEFVAPAQRGVTFAFEVGPDGSAVALTVSQGAMSLVFQRKP